MAIELRHLAAAALLLPVLILAISNADATAADCGYPPGSQDLFYNYYVGPGEYGAGVPAQLYLSPRPTPPLVGHTYYTYQPLLPHEMMYRHRRDYVYFHPGGAVTTTRVKWK